MFNFLTHLPYQLQVWHLGRCTRKLWHSWSTLDLRMVLPGEPATWRREGAGRYIAFPGVANLAWMSYGLPVLCHYSSSTGVSWCLWLLKLAEVIILIPAMCYQSSWVWENRYIALFWYFSKNCLLCPRVNRSRLFLLVCFVFETLGLYLHPSSVTQNSNLLPAPCWGSLSLCHQVWQPDPTASLQSLISAVLKSCSISSDLPDPAYYRKLEVCREVPARHFYHKTKQNQVTAWPSLWIKGKEENFPEEMFGLKYSVI